MVASVLGLNFFPSPGSINSYSTEVKGIGRKRGFFVYAGVSSEDPKYAEEPKRRTVNLL